MPTRVSAAGEDTGMTGKGPGIAATPDGTEGGT